MLLTVKSMKDLAFGKLMRLYIEGNRENGAELYPDEPENRQIFLAEQDFYRYLRESFFPTPGAAYYIWTENGSYISALRLEPYQDGLLLEALETAPDHRNMGCASKLIQAVLALRKEKIYSHISKKNTASIRTHEKCGFRKVLDHAVYVDGSVSARVDTYCR